MRIEIYTDGACSTQKETGNTYGGWAYYVRALTSQGGKKKLLESAENSGGQMNTNPSLMELGAILNALQEVSPVLLSNSNVHIYTDSKYAFQAFTKNIRTWRRNGWRTVEGTPVINKPILEQIATYVDRYNVQFHKVRAHAKHPHNDKVNDMAIQARLQIEKAS